MTTRLRPYPGGFEPRHAALPVKRTPVLARWHQAWKDRKSRQAAEQAMDAGTEAWVQRLARPLPLAYLRASTLALGWLIARLQELEAA